MVEEVLEHLLGDLPAGRPRLVVDGTVGLGGHAAAILDRTVGAELLGIDRDPRALVLAGEVLARFGARVRLVHASYADLAEVLRREGASAPDGVLLDLGLSSFQLDDPARGFSFQRAGEGADMRFDPTAEGPTALDLVNHLEVEALAELLHRYGEEPRARAVARAIVRARPIADAGTLAEVVRRAALRTGRHDPATRSFQALRIAVNDELLHVERGVAAALAEVAPGGRVVAISFHRLEDRIVKEAFREAGRRGWGRVRTKKPLRPSDAEVRRNRRARPARLRAFERLESVAEGEGA